MQNNEQLAIAAREAVKRLKELAYIYDGEGSVKSGFAEVLNALEPALKAHDGDSYDDVGGRSVRNMIRRSIGLEPV